MYPTRPKMGTRNTIASQSRPFMPRILASWYTQSAMSRNARYSPMRNNVNVVRDVAADAWNGIAMTEKSTVALLTPPLPMKSEVRMLRGIFIGCRATGAIPAGNDLFGHATLMFWSGRVGGTQEGGAHPRGRRPVCPPWDPSLPVTFHRHAPPGCCASLS